MRCVKGIALLLILTILLRIAFFSKSVILSCEKQKGYSMFKLKYFCLAVLYLILPLQLQMVPFEVYAQSMKDRLERNAERTKQESEKIQELRALVEHLRLELVPEQEEIEQASMTAANEPNLTSISTEREDDLKTRLERFAMQWIGADGNGYYQTFYRREQARSRNFRTRDRTYYRYDSTIASTYPESRFSPEEIALLDPIFHRPIRAIKEADDRTRERYRRLDEEVKARVQERTRQLTEGLGKWSRERRRIRASIFLEEWALLSYEERHWAREGVIYPYMRKRLSDFIIFPRDLNQLALAISHRDQLETCHRANNYKIYYLDKCLAHDPVERENFIREVLCSFSFSQKGCEEYRMPISSFEILAVRSARTGRGARVVRAGFPTEIDRTITSDTSEFRDAIDNFSMESRATFSVKLFPLAEGDSVYPTTTKEDQKYLSLFHPQGFRIEVYETGSTEGLLLAEGIREIEVNINCPDEPHCVENQFRYRQSADAEWESYTLGDLVDNGDFKLSSYIQVHLEDSQQPTDVRWGYPTIEVDRSYLGDFYMRVAQRTDGSRNMEWSLINELPVAQYARSVLSGEARSGYVHLEALKAQTVLINTFASNQAIRAHRLDRVWDVDPTTNFQFYPGEGRGHSQFDRAVAETLGLVLTYNGRPAYTQYHACVEDRTVKNPNSPVSHVRTIPSDISCHEYINGGGHGYGMPQVASYVLADTGWDDADSSPSQGAIVPEDINQPWSFQDILSYFYPNTTLEKL